MVYVRASIRDPLVQRHSVKSTIAVVVPKALYGCELWHAYTKEEMAKLEVAQNVCLKHMQQAPKYISSDFVLSSVNTVNIETIVDFRKLQFFGQLCRLASKYLAKSIFVNRLTSFYNGDSRQSGFITDAYRILSKYDIA